MLEHSASGGGYDGLRAALSVTVMDRTPGLRLMPDSLTVNEGSSTTYTVVLETEPTGTVTVTLDTVTGLTRRPASLQFTTANWEMAQIITLTADMDADAVTDTFMLGHRASGGGYDAITDELEVIVRDDDMVGLRLTPDSLRVDEGSSATYTVRLLTQPTGTVTVTLGTAEGLTRSDDRLRFTTTNWNSVQTVVVTAVTDSNGEAEVLLTHTASGGDYTAVTGEVRVTIVRSDEVMAEMQAAQELWLPQFGVMVMEHVLHGLNYRFGAGDGPGLAGRLGGLPSGGSSLTGGLVTGAGYSLGADGFGRGGAGGDRFGAGSADRPKSLSRTLSLGKLLRGSRFLYREQGGVSVWGQAAYSSYKDARDGVSVDGEVTTGMVGVDRDSGRTLLGLALSYSDGDGDWSGASQAGELTSSLLSLLPYIRHDLSESVQVWGALGYGEGELEQSNAGVEVKQDLEQLSLATGMRGRLLERPAEDGGLTLMLTTDAILSRIETSDDDETSLAGIQADMQRLRLGLEWSWQRPETRSGRIVPELELGVRYDGGDDHGGFGLELGGGIRWELPGRGLTLDIRGRRLLEHENSNRHEWGVSGSLRYDLEPGSAYGPSLSLSQEYGNAAAQGGLDRLLSGSLSDVLEEDVSKPGEATMRWSVKGEWGLALSDGATGIPYVRLSSAQDKRELTLGWRLLSAPGDGRTELDIKAMRRQNDAGETRHSIGAEWKLRW